MGKTEAGRLNSARACLSAKQMRRGAASRGRKLMLAAATVANQCRLGQNGYGKGHYQPSARKGQITWLAMCRFRSSARFSNGEVYGGRRNAPDFYYLNQLHMGFFAHGTRPWLNLLCLGHCFLNPKRLLRAVTVRTLPTARQNTKKSAFVSARPVLRVAKCTFAAAPVPSRSKYNRPVSLS